MKKSILTLLFLIPFILSFGQTTPTLTQVVNSGNKLPDGKKIVFGGTTFSGTEDFSFQGSGGVYVGNAFIVNNAINTTTRAIFGGGWTFSSTLGVADAVTTGTASTTNGSVVFKNSTNAFALTINSGVTGANHSWTLPTAQGSANSVLTNNGSGVLSWITGNATNWLLLGNSGTSATTNFIGSTDGVDVRFRTNNVFGGQLTSSYTHSMGFGAGSGALCKDANVSYNVWLGNNVLPVNTTGIGNVALGFQTLYSNTSGADNTACGRYALYSNTTAAYNTGVGKQALYNNTTGQYNTGVGSDALYGAVAGITGSNNTAIGLSTLFNVTSGHHNTAIGNVAMYQDIDGAYEVAIGDNALTNLTTGDKNVAVGKDAMSQSTSCYYNTAVGGDAMKLVVQTGGSAGQYNTCVGYGTMLAASTGAFNVALGFENMFNGAGDGANNVSAGAYGMYSNTTGFFDVAIGDKAMYSNTTGNYNTAIGKEALYTNVSGSHNMASGYHALYTVASTDNNVGIGEKAGELNTGSANTFIGFKSGTNNSTGNNNGYFGELAGANMTTEGNRIILNTIDRTTHAKDTTDSPIYIYENATVASQTVVVNGNLKITQGSPGSGKVLTSDANGLGSWQLSGSNLAHAISTPTTSATVTLNVNQINIINPSGTIAALTVNFPNSPSNNDFVEVTFDQIVTSVTYAAGTGGATIKGQINGVVGGQKRWDYDNGTNTWY